MSHRTWSQTDRQQWGRGCAFVCQGGGLNSCVYGRTNQHAVWGRGGGCQQAEGTSYPFAPLHTICGSLPILGWNPLLFLKEHQAPSQPPKNQTSVMLLIELNSPDVFINSSRNSSLIFIILTFLNLSWIRPIGWMIFIERHQSVCSSLLTVAQGKHVEFIIVIFYFLEVK